MPVEAVGRDWALRHTACRSDQGWELRDGPAFRLDWKTALQCWSWAAQSQGMRAAVGLAAERPDGNLAVQHASRRRSRSAGPDKKDLPEACLRLEVEECRFQTVAPHSVPVPSKSWQLIRRSWCGCWTAAAGAAVAGGMRPHFDGRQRQTRLAAVAAYCETHCRLRRQPSPLLLNERHRRYANLYFAQTFLRPHCCRSCYV